MKLMPSQFHAYYIVKIETHKTHFENQKPLTACPDISITGLHADSRVGGC